MRSWLPAAIPVAMLAVDPGGLSPFGPIKWLLVPTLVLAAFAVSPAGRPVDRRIVVAWSLFLGSVVLSAATGLDPLYSWIGTPERHFGSLTWVLCALAFVLGHRLDDDGRRAVVVSASVAGLVVGAWAVAEQLGWRPIELIGVGDRPVGPLGSSAYLGAAALLLAPCAISLRGRWRWRWLGVAAPGAAVMVSGARAAWIGALFVVALMVWSRRMRLRYAGLVVVAACALVLVCGLGGRATGVVTADEGGARGRVDEWRVAARVIADHPLVGVGPEGYRIAFGGAVDEAYERRHGRSPLPDRAHSALLDVAATTGLLGLAAYLGLLGIVAVRLVRVVRRGTTLLAGAAVAVLGYWIQSVFLFPLAELEPLAWLLAGVVIGASVPSQARRAPTRLAAALRNVTLVLSIGTATAGVLDVAADHRARHALDAVLPSVGQARAATRLRPDSVRYRLAAARVLVRRDSSLAVDQALAELDRALDVSPRDPLARLERARLLVVRARRSAEPGHRADAQRALRALLDDDPRSSVARELWNQIGGSGV